MSPPEYKLLPSNPKYKLRPTGAAPARRLRAARRAGICLCGTTTNDTKTTAPVVDARAAAIHGEAGVPARRGPRGGRIRVRAAALQAIFNGVQDAASLDVRNACRMKDHLPQERRNALVRGWCADEAAVLSEIERIQAEMAECTGIVDVDEREVLRARLAPATPSLLPPPLTLPPTRPVTVGVHIRWGDTGTPDTSPSHFRGSMNVPALVRVLADIRAPQLEAPGVWLIVAMENAEERVLAELGEAEYALLASGDALAAQDVLLLGESSWAVMVHLVAPPGLPILESSGRCIADVPKHHEARGAAGLAVSCMLLRALALLPLHALLLPASGALCLVVDAGAR
ncbi:hypothetical protein FB451DRAFT_1387260 [Mycena latifolia]|nr:hypothetical protein FB451DRAFT_1387260 [Mycena latifolia]